MRDWVVGRILVLVCVLAGGAVRAEDAAEVLDKVVPAHLTATELALQVSEWVPHPLDPDTLTPVTNGLLQGYPATAQATVGLQFDLVDVSNTSNRILIRGTQGVVDLDAQKVAVRAEAGGVMPGLLMDQFGFRQAQGKLFAPAELMFEEIKPDDLAASELPAAGPGPEGARPLLLTVKGGSRQLVWVNKETWLVQRLDVLAPDGSVAARYNYEPVDAAKRKELVAAWAARPKVMEQDYQLPADYGLLNVSTYQRHGLLPVEIGDVLDGALLTALRQSAGIVGVRGDHDLSNFALDPQAVFPLVDREHSYPVRCLNECTIRSGDRIGTTGRLRLAPEPGVNLTMMTGLNRHVIRPGMILERADGEWQVMWEREVPVTVPHEPKDCLQLALNLASVNRHKAAVPIAERLVKVAPRDPEALMVSAEVHRGNGELEAARKDLQRALTFAKGDARVPRLLGRVEFEAQDYAAAIKALKDAVALEPAKPATLRLLSQAQLYGGDLPGAVTSLEAALKVSPPLYKTRLILDRGWVEFYQGRSAEAIVQARLAQTTTPSNAEGYYLEATVSLYGNQDAQALALVLKGLEQDPGGAGYGQQVVAQLTGALKDNPRTPNAARLLLGVVYEAQGNLGDARDMYRKFTAMGGTGDLRKYALDRLEATKDWQRKH